MGINVIIINIPMVFPQDFTIHIPSCKMLLYTTLRTVYCTSKANADSQIHPKISVCQKSTQKNPASLIRCQIFLQWQSAGKTRTASHHSYCL